MTTIDLGTNWSINEAKVLQLIFKDDMTLRQSRPEITYETIQVDGVVHRVPERWSGIASYVWRLLVFTISERAQHQCMPIMAVDYLPTYPGMTDTMREAIVKFSDALVEKLIAKIPSTEWKGLAQWAKVL